MLISLAVHLLLLMFELLVADNLQAKRHLWILVSYVILYICLFNEEVGILMSFQVR